MGMAMFGERLLRARKAAGLSLRDLAAQVDLSHAAIKKYEDGAAMPSSDVLLRLAKALGVRSEYFFRPLTPALEFVEFRKRSSLPKKREARISHLILDQIERRLELEALFPKPPISQFRVVDGLPALISTYAAIEEIADQVRARWDLGSDSIPDVIDLLESRGIRVFMVDIDGDSKFDGLQATVAGGPVIVVADHWPGDRQRFTLIHELGHLMIHDRLATGLDEEKACNRFAGAFLLPGSAVRQELGEHRTSLELQELALLKDEFGLSMQAILYRAADLGVISQSYFQHCMRSFKLKGWNRKEPGSEYKKEVAHLFQQMLFHALAEDYIGESKAAELLGMPMAEFRSLRSMENVVAPGRQ
jgi:Zn-dependent peptidase ImmA (M78 family)/transcriptional regulator with XRE-family HTH domain